MLSVSSDTSNRIFQDKFYTKPEIANKCCDLLKKYVKLSTNDICIEPSAGNGSFIEPLLKLFKRPVFLDLYPENKNILKRDFLNWDVDNLISPKQKTHVIGNPPFGRNSSKAIKFVKKACSFADTVAFILPQSFKKNSMKRFFPANFHLIHEYIIPKDSFYNNETSYDVKCVYQIWVKKKHKRFIQPRHIPIGYKFVKKNENPHISIVRVGFKSGQISTNISTKSPQTNYFIRFKKFSKTLFNQIQNLEFETKSFTVGPRSISKQDIIQKINVLI